MTAATLPHARAVPAGHEPERIAMRAGEDRTLLIDCAPLLAEGERVDGIAGASVHPAGLRVTRTPRMRSGGLAELSVRAPAATEIRTWRDFALSARLRTSKGQSLALVVTVRVYRE